MADASDLPPNEEVLDAIDEARAATPGLAPRLYSADEVRTAATVVDVHMAFLGPVNKWREDAKGVGGAPESFPLRSLLIVVVLCVLDDRPMLLSEFARIICDGFAPEERAALGLPAQPDWDDEARRLATYRNVRTRFHSMLNVIDPSVLPKNYRLTPTEQAMRSRTLTPEEVDLYDRRLAWVSNQIVQASFRCQNRETRRRLVRLLALRSTTINLGIDDTPIRAFARPETSSVDDDDVKHVTVCSADPDAQWYIRKPEDRDPATRSPNFRGRRGWKRLKPKLLWAMDAAFAVARTADENDPLNNAVLGIGGLRHPGREPARFGVTAASYARLLIAELGGTPGTVSGDSLYSNLLPDTYHRPIRALGFEHLLDYKSTQLGIQDSYGGANLVEGWWYCPSMPKRLVDATKDFRNRRIEEPEFRDRIARRDAYRFRIKDRDAEGHMRLMCPAAGKAATATCKLKPGSRRVASLGKIPVFADPLTSEHPPTVCQQESTTFPPEAGDRFLQALPYESERWITEFKPSRSVNEGAHGYMKDGAHEALDDPGRRRLRGRAAQTILVAFQVYAANLRRIRNALRALTISIRKDPTRRRTTRPISDWAPPAVTDPPGAGPPRAGPPSDEPDPT